MVGTGGRRPGAGRPKGSRNGRTTAALEAAKARGELPHEWLLSIMHGDEKPLGRKPEPEERMEAAKACAPYYAPKLKASEVDMTVKGDAVADLFARISNRSKAGPGERPATAAKDGAHPAGDDTGRG